MAGIQYGADMRKQFDMLPGHHFTNHGSWGLAPNCVLDEKTRVLREVEQCPDKFYRWVKDDQYNEMKEIAAKFVGADPENLVITANATTAVNTVVKALTLNPGEGILVNNLTYGAVRKTCQAACARVDGAVCHVLQFDFPIESEDSFVEKYETFLNDHPDVKLAIVDQITSSTALALPVKRLIEVFRRHNVLVMVDGAHAPGQLPINIEETGADFYTGNLHKWCYVPRGCAVLWVHPRHQSWVVPLVTSHKYRDEMQIQFMYQATMDYSSYFCIKAGLQFYKDVGGYEKIHAHTTSLSSKAATMLAQAWGTELLAVPETMRAPNMKSIRLPPLPYENTEVGSIQLMKDIFDKYKVISCVCPMEGMQLYMRISAQIYNTMEDYEALKNAVLEIKKNSRGL